MLSDTILNSYFDYTEFSVKTLICSYFNLFKKNNLAQTYNLLQTHKDNIPYLYINEAEIIDLKDSNILKNCSFKKESLLKIPKSDNVILFDIDNIKYSLSLEVTINKSWDDSLFKDKDIVKQKIGDLIMMTQFVFNYLKKSNKILETIKLEIDTSNITIKIIDSKFPNYIHPLVISIKFIQI